MKKSESNFRGWSWAMAVSLSVLATACGGGGGGGDKDPILGAGEVALAVRPTVTSVAPLPGAAPVPLNTRLITATFSQPMEGASLGTDSFTLACPSLMAVAGRAVTYFESDRTATLALPVGTLLPAGERCTATVGSSVRDKTGLTLAQNFVWQFTTGAALDTTAPTVTSTINANGASNVSINTKIGATFSEAMDPLSLAPPTFSVTQGTNLVPGSTSYSGVSAVFTPTSALAFNTTYTASLSTAAKDLAGNPLAANYVWSWTTGAAVDTTAPTVTSTLQANNATNVDVNTQAGATFSEAMNPQSIKSTNVVLRESVSAALVAGVVTYSGMNASFKPLASLLPGTRYTLTIKGGAGGVEDLAGNPMAADSVTSWTTADNTTPVDRTAPTVVTVNPADLATGVSTGTVVNATFDEAMDPQSINNASFTVAGVTGTVSYDAAQRIATFTPSMPLAKGTLYTATVSTAVADLAGNIMKDAKVWRFTTAADPVVTPVVTPAIPLNTAGRFGTFGGTAGMTNMGTLTQINGDMGTTATGTSMITGFHDTAGDVYTETGANMGAVNGKIFSCTNSVTGPTANGVNAAACAAATQARLDAQTAYLALAAMPAGANPGVNLAGLTLLPGTYTAPAGSFMVQGGNLTLDAQGNANAVWIFQMATTLTVGGPGAAFPQSIILAGGAQAKNVFWQVGSFATINAAGGGTMVGTIISQSGASFSTAGNVSVVTLQGRVLSLGGSVTLVNTVINVPQ